jgi:uncharacterized membrane protein YadS
MTPAATLDQSATVAPRSTTATVPPAIHEDWVAVWIAVAIVALVLAGVRPGTPQFGWAETRDLATVFGADNLWRSLQVGILIMVPATAGAWLMGVRPGPFVAGFAVLYGLAWSAQAMAGYAGSSAIGLEYVIYALLLGLCLGHATPLKRWLGDAVQAEYYIKIGLVVLGAGIIFGELIEAGLLGIAQALVVVVAVWFFAFWLARRLRVDDELATMMATAVSICGVTAAIAACGAIQGDRKKLSYVTSLVLVVAVPMMIVMPWISQVVGMPDVVAGAWLGGTLDTSAAVVAAGEMVSLQARNAAVVVKLSQNVLIGIAACALTVWWTLRQGGSARLCNLTLIWERFPKFVLGFIAMSLVFSFVLAESYVTDTRGLLNVVRVTWFTIAFVAIGLEASVLDLVRLGDGRPAVAFLGGQAFNVVVTLILAYLLFGGLLFPAPTFN